MERETEVTVRVGGREFLVHGFYEADDREFGIDRILGDVLDYLPSDKFNEIVYAAQAAVEQQEAERRMEEAAYRGSVER